MDCLCREHARSIPGKSQVFVNAYARALEVIPRQLCDNAGFDATDVLSRLRNKHAQSEDRGKHFGIDISTGAQAGAVSCTHLCRALHQHLLGILISCELSHCAMQAA